MPKEYQADPRRSFTPRFLPWLAGGIMLVVYWVTLNHWVTLSNIGEVTAVSGWSWQPQIASPIIFFVTLPFRLLPAALVPVALNAFAACCGAATLAILARSVAILPHDRTDMERSRERSDFSFFTGWAAWVPPVAAVVFAGFQLGFWENSTSFSGETFDLLLFAVILWQALEYRLDEREERLVAAAFLYGAGMVENWAMIGFFPLFLTLLIWIRGFSFFHAGFLIRTTLSGLAGLLLLLLLAVPVEARFSGSYPAGFGAAIVASLRNDWQIIGAVKSAEVRHSIGLMSLTSLLPAFLMSIRWSSTFGDSSRLGATLVNYFMHFVNAILLGVLAWAMFDPAISPARLGLRGAGLTLYYITALGIGYYTGYFLLVFGKTPESSRRRSRPEPALPKPLVWLAPVIWGGAVACLAIGAGLLIYKNTPALRAANDDTLLKFARHTLDKLPPNGGILLCDSDQLTLDAPLRSDLIQAALAREGRSQKFPVVDTHALEFAAYHDYLHRRFPTVWPAPAATNILSLVPPIQIIRVLSQLSQSNNLCYLNPSFGYYFEFFYQEPHGLVYAMKALSTNMWVPPALDTNLIAENQAFWSGVLESAQPAIEKALRPRDWTLEPKPIAWLMLHLHVLPDINPNAVLAGAYYSKSLNAAGAQFQRAGALTEAAALFSAAQALNTNNVVAGINLAFNKTLRAGSPTPVDLSRVTADQFGRYRDWNEVLAANGPFDETSFCFGYGYYLIQAKLVNQAAAAFTRVRQLAPHNLATRLFLAQIAILHHQPDRGLEALHDPMVQPKSFLLTESNSIEFDETLAGLYFQKGEIPEGVKLLDTELNRHANDARLILVTAETFNLLGLRTNALQVIHRPLDPAPSNFGWLFRKGIVTLQAGAFDEAAADFTKVLAITNHASVLFDRGLAYFQGGHLDAARKDFLQIQGADTNNFQVAYALAEIGWRQHETNEALRNYRLYLAHAPTNSPDQKLVHERVIALDGK